MVTPTERIIAYFKQISAIPRCSKNEAQIRRWLIQWAESRGLAHKTDGTGNLVITVPASPGYEASPAVVLQGHLDMVCEKTPDSRHDFSNDPIQVIADGDWLRGQGTTLGADNGIAVALAMAIVDDDSSFHPALELLMTVDEESGLNGAKKLDASLLEGRILLNLDSETEGEFTIGCAGGMDTHVSYKPEYGHTPESFRIIKLQVAGLRGGHSGIDIHRGRASANAVLSRVMHHLHRKFDQRIISVHGGTAHNAIARDAEALTAYSDQELAKVAQELDRIEQELQNEYRAVEPHLNIGLQEIDQDDADRRCLTEDSAGICLKMMLAMAHGPLAMSAAMPALVETSTNFATVRTTASSIDLLTSHRSSAAPKLKATALRIEALAALAGASVRHNNSYPPWQPDPDSPLLDRCRVVYRETFEAEPKVASIHAGLECALIGDRCPGMQMISFGPTIEDPHSPDERLYLPSIGRVWSFLKALLASYKQQ